MKLKLSNPYVYKSIIIISISFLIYSPIYFLDPMFAYFVQYFSYYYSPFIIFLLGIIIFFKQLRKPNNLLFLFMIISYLPHLTHYIAIEIKDYMYVHQRYSVEKLKEDFQNENIHYGFLIYTNVNYEKGHMILSAKYNSEEDERYTGDPILFREKLIEVLRHEIFDYSMFYKLEYITLEVEYFNSIYRFYKVPLKDLNGQPYKLEDDNKNEIIEKSIRERMTIDEKK